MLALVGQPLSRVAEPSTQGVQPLVIALQVGLQGMLQALFGLPNLPWPQRKGETGRRIT